jgi:hypothetical protein
VLFDSCRSSTTWIQQPYTRTNELLKILVARYDHDIHLLLESLHHESPDDVVGFVSRKSHDGNPVTLEQLADTIHSAIEVCLELFCQLFTCRLVGRIRFVPE